MAASHCVFAECQCDGTIWALGIREEIMPVVEFEEKGKNLTSGKLGADGSSSQASHS